MYPILLSMYFIDYNSLPTILVLHFYATENLRNIVAYCLVDSVLHQVARALLQGYSQLVHPLEIEQCTCHVDFHLFV